MRYEVERLTANFFGSVRKIELSKDKRENNEIIFSIERRDENGKYIPRKEYGYMTKTEEMHELIDYKFYTGCDRIMFIQWEDEWGVIFDETSIIGGISFRMDFDEFDKVFSDF